MVNPLASPLYLVSPLVAFAIGLSLSILVILKGYERPTNRLFVLSMLCFTLLSGFLFLMRASTSSERALYWERWTLPMAFAMFTFYYHFISVYTGSVNRKLVWAVYSLLVVVCVLSPTNFIVSYMALGDYGYTPHFYPVMYFISAGTFFFLFMGLVHLMKALRDTSRFEERNRYMYMIIAVTFPVIFGVIDIFPNHPPLTVFGHIIFSFLTAIAILKYHLLDIHIAMRKGLVYLIISVIVAVPYSGVLYLLHYFIEPAVEKWWMHFVVIFGLAILLRPIYSHAQDGVNRLFYRDRYSYLRALEQFAQEVQSVENLKTLGDSMTHLVKGALRASSVCLLLLAEEQHGFTVISHVGLKQPISGLMLIDSSPLLKWLDLHGDIITPEQLDIIPKLQSLSLKEKNNLKRMEAELYVPLKVHQGQLSGLLILGPKLSRQLYSNAERQLLITLSSQMAIALENSRLYYSEKTVRIELEKLNEQKTEFLHNVAHELKTPLTAIIASSEILSEDSLMSHEFKGRLLTNIRKSAESMNTRVTELLSLAQMQIGELSIEPIPLEIGHAITEVVSQIGILFRAKMQTLTLEIPDSLSMVNADEDKLKQILLNLLSNANKFSPSGTDIILRVRETNKKVIVEVEDLAPAVTEEEKKRIFNPYYRGEDSDERKRLPGVGLGLAISKKLVELHEGEIWVERKLSKGNIFAFSLPVLNKGASKTK